jgi:hypothetical protein
VAAVEAAAVAVTGSGDRGNCDGEREAIAVIVLPLSGI